MANERLRALIMDLLPDCGSLVDRESLCKELKGQYDGAEEDLIDEANQMANDGVIRGWGAGRLKNNWYKKRANST